ncbi:hypothetical protein BJX64DRAFT_48504 [Aspergillus heterothallicus]
MAKKYPKNKSKRAHAITLQETEEEPAPESTEPLLEPVEIGPEEEVMDEQPAPESTEPLLESVEIGPEEDVMDEQPVPSSPSEDSPEIHIGYNQPARSPYEHPIATVYIGNKRYGIPADFLESIPHFKKQLDRKVARELVLDDVDEDIGHTLIHFLCTGRYETLYSGNSIATEYRRSALAYEVARRYGLRGLEDLARTHIKQFGPLVQLQVVLETVRDIFPNLPADEKWFKDYLKERLADSFNEDRDFFRQEELSKAISQSTVFERTIMQLTVDILFTRISELEATVDEIAPAKEPGDQSESEAEPEGQAVRVLEPLSESEVFPEPAPEPESDLGPASEPESHLERLEVVAYSPDIPPAPEPDISHGLEYTDNSGGLCSPPPVYPVEPQNDATVSPRVRSPIEISPATEPVVDPWSSFFTTKKHKKKNKKKSFAAEKVA